MRRPPKKPNSKYGFKRVWLKVPKIWIFFCNACGEYITEDTGCSNPFCPERIIEPRTD